MTTSNISPSTIGWTAIAIGVSVILAVIFLILMYTVNGRFGTVNDVLNAIIGVLSMVLAWMLFVEHYTRSPMLSQVTLTLTVIGMVFTIIGSVMIIFGYTDFVLAGWYTGVGNALIGLWLAAFCFSNLNNDLLPKSLIIFGIIVGLSMAIGLIGIPGIFAKIDSMESMPWYLYVALFGWLGTYIFFPIWAIWFGRVFIQ